MSVQIYSQNTYEKNLWAIPFVPPAFQEAGERAKQKGALTLYGGSLGEDGDGSLGDVLLLQQRAHLGAPRVRAHPEEMADLVCPLRRRKDLPAEKNFVFTN